MDLMNILDGKLYKVDNIFAICFFFSQHSDCILLYLKKLMVKK